MSTESVDWRPLFIALDDGTPVTEARWRPMADVASFECEIAGKTHTFSRESGPGSGSAQLGKLLERIGPEQFGQRIHLRTCVTCVHFDMSGMAADMAFGVRGNCLLHNWYVDICYRCDDYYSLERLRPTWKPQIPLDLDAVETAFRKYTEEKTTYALYTNGTIVVGDPFSPFGKSQCDSWLQSIPHLVPSISVKEMDDGNFLVRLYFVDAVVLREEFEKHRSTIESGVDQGGAIPEDVIRQDYRIELPSQRDHRYVAFFARARLYMDAENPKIVRKYKSMTRW